MLLVSNTAGMTVHFSYSFNVRVALLLLNVSDFKCFYPPKQVYLFTIELSMLCMSRGDEVIAVVYYRSGYSPDDYGSEEVRILQSLKCEAQNHHICSLRESVFLVN